MQIGRNMLAMSAYKGVRKASNAVANSMRKMSSGERVNRPGDGPADFGISEKLRFQIRNTGEALRNIEKARSMINSADSWMQVTHEILQRMSELAISAADGSKTADDRNSLHTELTQLQEEISRISREAKFNGVPIAGRDQMLTYDQDRETFYLSQLDGKESYPLNVKVLSGLQSENSLDFLFDPTNDFTLSDDGRYIFYADSNNNLARYDIEAGSLIRETTDTETKGLDVDAEGRLWYARETAGGSGVFTLRQHDISTWAQDQTIVANGDIADMGSTEFSVFEDKVYYLDTNGDIISRSLSNTANSTVHLTTNEVAFTTTAGQFAISEDGRFVADVPSAGTVRVINTETKESASYTVDPNVVIADLTFGVDTRDLAFVDTATGNIHSVQVKPGELPELEDGRIIHNASGASGFTGLSLDGGSHRQNFRVHDGPNELEETYLTAGDVRLHTLGITQVDVRSVEAAQETLGKVMKAISKLAIQRSRLGAEESRMDHTYEALQQYTVSMEMADAVIRDADIAEETGILTQNQMMQEAALSLLAQANRSRDSLVALLRA